MSSFSFGIIIKLLSCHSLALLVQICRINFCRCCHRRQSVSASSRFLAHSGRLFYVPHDFCFAGYYVYGHNILG